MEYLYRIFCKTENDYKFIKQSMDLDAPTACPDSDQHDVEQDTLAIVEKIPELS